MTKNIALTTTQIDPFGYYVRFSEQDNILVK